MLKKSKEVFIQNTKLDPKKHRGRITMIKKKLVLAFNQGQLVEGEESKVGLGDGTFGAVGAGAGSSAL